MMTQEQDKQKVASGANVVAEDSTVKVKLVRRLTEPFYETDSDGNEYEEEQTKGFVVHMLDGSKRSAFIPIEQVYLRPHLYGEGSEMTVVITKRYQPKDKRAANADGWNYVVSQRQYEVAKEIKQRNELWKKAQPQLDALQTAQGEVTVDLVSSGLRYLKTKSSNYRRGYECRIVEPAGLEEVPVFIDSEELGYDEQKAIGYPDSDYYNDNYLVGKAVKAIIVGYETTDSLMGRRLLVSQAQAQDLAANRFIVDVQARLKTGEKIDLVFTLDEHKSGGRRSFGEALSWIDVQGAAVWGHMSDRLFEENNIAVPKAGQKFLARIAGVFNHEECGQTFNIVPWLTDGPDGKALAPIPAEAVATSGK